MVKDLKKNDGKQTAAYVVPASRIKTRVFGVFGWRQIAVGAAVLALHAVLGWAVLAFSPKPLKTVEFAETLVTLEQPTSDLAPASQSQSPTKSNTALPNAERSKNDARTNRSSVPALKSDKPKPSDSTASSSVVSSSMASSSTVSSSAPAKKLIAECHQANKLMVSSSLVERPSTALLMVQRSAQGRATSASMLKSTGKAALDAMIVRKVLAGLRFVKKDGACDGMTMKMPVVLQGD